MVLLFYGTGKWTGSGFSRPVIILPSWWPTNFLLWNCFFPFRATWWDWKPWLRPPTEGLKRHASRSPRTRTGTASFPFQTQGPHHTSLLRASVALLMHSLLLKFSSNQCCCCLRAQSCLTLCDPMDCSLPGSSPWDSSGKNTGVGCHAPPSPTRGSSRPGDQIHVSYVSCIGRWVLYQLSQLYQWPQCKPQEPIPVCSSQNSGQKLALAQILIYIGVGNGNPLQYCCLKNPMDRGTWWTTVHSVEKSQTRLIDWARIDIYYLSEKLWTC